TVAWGGPCKSLATTPATAIARSTTETVDPSERSRMNKNERATSTDRVLNRSPMSRVGITYIDTDIEKTNATPAITPGIVSGTVTRTNRCSGLAPRVAAASSRRGEVRLTTGETGR